MRQGFSLFELLIVMTIISILAVAALVVMNPVETLAGSRDARRISELASIDESIALALEQDPALFEGDPNKVYISLPDNNEDGNCLDDYPSLPPLVSPWQYACAKKSNLSKNDGTGWLPLNFANLPIPALDALPVDPVNSAVKGYYYTYVLGWELNANLESKKYEWGGGGDRESTDGGDRSDLYERGASVTLAGVGPTVGAPVSCGIDSIMNAQNFENYPRWTPVLGSSQTVLVTKLWIWQFDGSLGSNETVEVAIYNDGAGGSRISEVVQIQGTGVSGWIGKDLVTPIQITLGNTYVFGIGPGSAGVTYNLTTTVINGCVEYPPTSPTRRYWTGASGGLNSSVPASSDPWVKHGFVGISYAKN